MKEIKKQIEDLSTKISQVQDENYKEIFGNVLGVLEGLSAKVQEILVNETVLAENFKYMDDDISNLQEELFQEVTLEELDEIEEEFKEVNCKHCGKIIFIETSALKENDKISCPYCNENII
ncbi:C2HC5-type zinc finger protein [Clostridium sp. SHJSY1]|uniref:CD1247 N-terminal domain-containing protein n=1 Tax=Clostridium sp. SHJSY1 TaxID=2942483 RepID=UPI002875768B|nr:CD1247 N-terminal domain-containing protein [Clostridium sp. SHJSY1]MDS0527328.1 C2HC5-type zinc finger protein [Clostridium sp. SHJSY1]